VGSEGILFASLLYAYNLGEPWVGYLYAPSWIIGRVDVVMLEDEPFDPETFRSGATEFPSQNLVIASSRFFPSRAPALVEFLSNFSTTADAVSEALAYLEETGESHANVALWFMRTHDNLLDEWLTPDRAARVRSAL